MKKLRLQSLLLLCGFGLLFGCGGPKPTSSDLNKTNLDRLKNCYEIYMSENEYVGPKDEQELNTFLTKNKGAAIRLKKMGITPELQKAMFTSDRDGKPFKVKYGVEGFQDHAVIFETTGVKGMRYVALNTPIEVDAATYDKYWNGEIEAPDQGAEPVFVEKPEAAKKEQAAEANESNDVENPEAAKEEQGAEATESNDVENPEAAD